MKSKILFGALALAMGFGFAACNDDDTYNISTDPMVSAITTTDVAVTATSASVTATVDANLADADPSTYTVGAAYADNADMTNPTLVRGQLDGSVISATITGLQTGKVYYIAGYMQLQGKLNVFGNALSVTTTDAKVSTGTAEAVTEAGATISGNVKDIAAELASGMTHGIAIGATADMADPVFFDTDTRTETFSVPVTGLIPATEYFYAAYMTVNGAPVLGEAKAFTTAESLLETENFDSEYYVDLGLSKQWASYNVGATKASETGALIGYGDAKGLNRSDDAATYAEGNIAGTDADPFKAVGIGMLPTDGDWAELIANCDASDETLDGVAGTRYTSRKTGKSIFLPAAGIRAGLTTEAGNGYWTGTAYNADAQYALGYIGGKKTITDRSTGLAVRTVRLTPQPAAGIAFIPGKIVGGDIEGNGKYRIELYNAYGSTAADPAFNPNDVVSNVCMSVTFAIAGVGDGEYKAQMCLADADWSPQFWGDGSDNGACTINGDGEYTVRWNHEAEGKAEGATVFVIDIDGLSAAVGADNVSFQVKSIVMDDFGTSVAFDANKFPYGNIEGAGNFRIEFQNEYGSTKGNPALDPADIKFDKYLGIEFELKGVPSDKEYDVNFYLTNPSWWPSFDIKPALTVKGDGVYRLFIKNETGSTWTGPAFVFTIDIPGLAADAPDCTATVRAINVL